MAFQTMGLGTAILGSADLNGLLGMGTESSRLGEALGVREEDQAPSMSARTLEGSRPGLERYLKRDLSPFLEFAISSSKWL